MSPSSNNNKECKHKVLSETDLSCTICGMSRYDQLKNNEGRLNWNRRKRIRILCKSKTLGIDALMINK